MRTKVIIVDANDHIIGSKNRRDVDFEKDRVRFSRLWIEDSVGNVLIRRRGNEELDFNPGLFVFAVCAISYEDDTYEWATRRKAREELGVRFPPPLTPLAITPLRDPIRKGFIAYFRTVMPGIRPEIFCDSKEAASAKWVSREELKSLMKKSPKLFVEDLLKMPRQFRLL